MAERPDLEEKVGVVRGLLVRACSEHQRLTYANSLGSEAMVLFDLIGLYAPQIDVFTIDTGRLHEETYEVLEKLQHRHGVRIRVIYPDAAALERLVARQGANGFYNSIEARMACCRTRKVEPFLRAIAGFSAWITGVRRGQSALRAQGTAHEWDAEHGLYKISPLLDWSEEEVWWYIRTRNLPYNRLHDRSYPSIGCQPCTRAVRAGEAPGGGSDQNHANAGCMPDHAISTLART